MTYQQLQALAQGEGVLSVHLDAEQTRHRHTTRMATVFPLTASIQAIWHGVQQGLEVIRQGTRQGGPCREQRYYIIS